MNQKSEKTYFVGLFGMPIFCCGWRQAWMEPETRAEASVQKVWPSEQDSEPGFNEPVFVVNSLMLHRCFRVLTRTSEEDLHVVTGSVFGNVRTLEQIIPLSLSEQGPAGAAAEDGSLVEGLVGLNEHGLLPLAYFHSHPGHGVDATKPSGTDRRTQSRLEQSGSKIIGGIFSRDGFVRFYSNRDGTNVRVIGKKVRKVGKDVYKLEIEEDVPD